MDNVKKLIVKDKITIISQNLQNYPKKNKKEHTQQYISQYKADVYAFQEYPIWGRGKTFYTKFELKDDDYDGVVNEIEKIWKKYFPWSEFPSGYFREIIIEFNGIDIHVINIHISHYFDLIRFVLLKRLQQLKNDKVIILGDFNAAFSNQTDDVNIEGNEFLTMLRDKYKFSEVLGEDETDKNPHYTRGFYNKRKEKWIKSKLDHIFISQEIAEKRERGEWDIKLTYIDEVNRNLLYITNHEPQNPLSDHSGMKLIINENRK